MAHRSSGSSSPAPGSWVTASPRSTPRSASTVVLYEPDLARAAGRPRRGSPATSIGRSRRASSTGAERDATLGRVDGDRRPRRASRDADLVIEAVFEDLEVKRDLWRELDERAPEATIFASNTSSISIDRLAEAVAPGAARAVRRHALLQPGAGDAARRADPRRGDDGRDRGRDPRARRPSSARRSSSPRTGRASSSTGSSCRSSPRRCAPSRRASARPTTSTPARGSG